MSEHSIYIIGDEEDDVYAKGLGDAIARRIPVPTMDLKRELDGFLNEIDSLFSDIETNISRLELKEIDLNINISTSGKISLIGSVETGVEGGITIKLKRKKRNA